MLSLGSKFAHYGLTGGFLLLIQLCVFVFIVPPDYLGPIVSFFEENENLRYLLSLFQKFTENERTWTLAIVFILLCFVFGLILDMMGSYATFWEARVLARNLKRYQIYLIPLLGKINSSAISDLEEIVATYASHVPIATKEERRRAFSALLLRRKAGGQELKRWSTLNTCARLEAILLSYSLSLENLPLADLLRDKLHICHVARPISVVIGFSAIEIFFVIISIAFVSRQYDILPLLVQSVPLLLLLRIALFIPTKAYSRYCDSLFSIILIHSQKLAKTIDFK